MSISQPGGIATGNNQHSQAAGENLIDKTQDHESIGAQQVKRTAERNSVAYHARADSGWGLLRSNDAERKASITMMCQTTARANRKKRTQKGKRKLLSLKAT